MYTSDLVNAVITNKHGWAVAEQFSATFDGEPFEEQNMNALDYIKATCNEIVRSRLLSEDAQYELEQYMGNLEDYLKAE